MSVETVVTGLATQRANDGHKPAVSMNEKPEVARATPRQMVDARTAFPRELSLPFRGVAENTAYAAYELDELKRRAKT